MKKLLLATVATIALAANGAMAAEPSAHGGGGSKNEMKGQELKGQELKGHAAGEMKGHAAGRAETTGSGATKSGADVKAGDVKADTKAGNGARGRSETTGAGDSDKTPAPKAQSGGSTSASTTGSTSGTSVQLNADQKTRIRTTVIQASGAPKIDRSQIKFSLNVGTVVPRSVKVVTVPTTLVDIHPAWRGYMYFVVGDELVIVEPGTLKIVAVLVV